MDPALFELAKTLESGQPWPRPVCPKCQTGHVGFSAPIQHPNFMSPEEQEHMDPEWITGTFTTHGQCENPECQQVVHGTGDYSVGISQKSWVEDDEYYSAYYTLRHVHPPILMMTAPKAATDEVKHAIARASRVLFVDPGLAATALRATVEVFLTSQDIASTEANGAFRSAHDRIREWGETDPSRPQLADLFFAVKWLGNAGTHEVSDLTAVQVLDGARVLDEAFHRLFTAPDIDAHAQAINAGKGPTPNP